MNLARQSRNRKGRSNRGILEIRGRRHGNGLHFFSGYSAMPCISRLSASLTTSEDADKEGPVLLYWRMSATTSEPTMKRIILFLLLAITGAFAQSNSPQFRGEHSVGVATGRDLPTHWSTNQNVAWKVSV